MLAHSIDRRAKNCYVIQTVFDWKDPISHREFKAAWYDLAQRHETLRSLFSWNDSEPARQVIVPEVSLDFRVEQINAGGEEQRKAAISAFLDADLDEGFSLSARPPWRVTVLEFPDSVVAVWTFHHLLLDGRSHVLLLKELVQIYDGFAGELPSAPSQRQFSEWIGGNDSSGSQDFWKEYLLGSTMPTALPPAVSDQNSGAKYSSFIDYLGEQLTYDLKTFSTISGISIGNVIQASWAFLVGWLANQTDVVIGAVRACRKSTVEDSDHLIGLTINTLPLRVKWHFETSVGDVLSKLASDWYNFRKHEHTSLQQIRKWIALPAGDELFGTVVSFSSTHFSEAVLPDKEIRRRRHLWLRQTTPYCSLDVGLTASDAEIHFSLPSNVVAPDLSRRLPEYLRNIVRQVISDVKQPVRRLAPLPFAEREQLIFGFNSRWEPQPQTIDWIDRMSDHARDFPQHTAIADGINVVSWQALEEHSNRLAAFLRDQDVTRDTLIAVFLARSPAFIWTCLGILKAGAAYLPLDIQWPSQRVATVLDDAKVSGTIMSRTTAPMFPNHDGRKWLAEDCSAPSGAMPEANRPDHKISTDQLAYVIYTSGSTGVPKGVEITHGALQNLINDMLTTFGLHKDERASFLSNTAFDASVHEVWPPLAALGSVYIPDSTLLADPAALLTWIEQQQISFSFMSVIMTEAITRLARGRSLALRYLLTGGDQLRMIPPKDLCFPVVNEYGPTEYTVVATRYSLAEGLAQGEPIPIGRPIAGTRAYVVNSSLQLLPAGVPGELLLAGNGIGQRYRNRPELTAEKFPSGVITEEPSQHFYRTGDLVRWSNSGNLYFLGRIDSQVKLRGFRIELGEIEACILRHAAIREAVVVFQQEPEPSLVAFVVLKSQHRAEFRETELLAHLRGLLPAYMIPAQLVCLDDLPTNSSGKYDRKQLAARIPARDHFLPEGDTLFTSAVEQEIAELWKEVLGVPHVKPSDRFLSLGGTSLSIIKLICAIEAKFGADVPAAELFRDPTPADIAKLLEPGNVSKAQPLVWLNGNGVGVPLFCIPGAAGGVHWFRELAGAFAPEQSVIGVELLSLSEDTQRHFSVDRAATEIAELIATTTSLRQCSICGFSGGGLLALESAQKLRAKGIAVSVVALLETYIPSGSTGFLHKAVRWIRGWWSLPPKQRFRVALDRIQWIGNSQRASAPAGVPEDILEIKRLHTEAFARHTVTPYSGRVELFFAEDRPISANSLTQHDWSRVLTGPLHTSRLPGNHYSLLQGDNARHLANYISKTLALAASADPGP
jgi:amino acid adenylation domain-containing protein